MAYQMFRSILVIGALCLPQLAQLQQTTNWAQEKIKLDEMRQTWKNHDIHDYSFLLDVSCFGCFYKYPASILIEEDKVVVVLNPDSGEPLREKTPDGTPGRSLWPEQAELFPTIDELFEIVQNAIKARDGSAQSQTIATPLLVEYDETYGIPLTIFIDDTRTVGGRISTDRRMTFRLADLSY